NIIGIYENDQLQAALILMIENGKTVYLKGAASQEVKLKGGMYLMMQEAVEKAIERGDTFDFGGSRIDGVRKFNLSFGGEDCRYYRYSWSNGPLYYRLIKKLRNRWRKK
ncbi:MAG: lipid II:glycine glycyltransferase (peptidoglycan interpeptide bridge formation enzyme), partial [Lentimonas sp.]